MARIAEHFLSPGALAVAWPLLWLGLGATLRLVGATFVLALALGLVVLWARTRRSGPLRAAAIAYLDVVRATPPLVALVVGDYGLPALGLLSLGVRDAALVALTLLHAARALALSDLAAARHVLVPQAPRAVLPPLTSQLTQIVRDSPLALVIDYRELLARAREARALTANSTPIAAAGALYLALLLALQGCTALAGRRTRRRRQQPWPVRGGS